MILGWFDHNGIRLPLDTFKRRGWVNSVFAHERAHWTLAQGSPFGIAEQVVSHLRIFAQKIGVIHPQRLTYLLEKMHTCNFLTQEGVASFNGVEYAIENDKPLLFDDFLSGLPNDYRIAYNKIKSILDAIDVPLGGRSRIALYVGLVAQGSDILEDWNVPRRSFSYLIESLANHSPDLRLSRISNILGECPKQMGMDLLQHYIEGRRPPVPAEISSQMQCRLLPPESKQKEFVKLGESLIRCLFRPDIDQVGLPRPDDACSAATSYIKQLGAIHDDPYWVTSAVPVGLAHTSRHSDAPPCEIWKRAKLISIKYESRNSEVTLFLPEDRHRYMTNDLKGLAALIKQNTDSSLPTCLYSQALLATKPKDFSSYFGGTLPLGGANFLIHLGSFVELLFCISPALNSKNAARCLLMPSLSSTRYTDGGNLRDLDVNAFGYALIKLHEEGLPVLIWPVAVFVAEEILGDRARMKSIGIEIIEDPSSALIDFFPSIEMLEAFDRLRSIFETGRVL